METSHPLRLRPRILFAFPWFLLGLAVLSAPAAAEEKAGVHDARGAAPEAKAAAPDLPLRWDLDALSRPPEVFPAPGLEAPGVRALFYAGLPWKGKPTRVFAWYGVPAGHAGEKLPAMVLVHGGGGTAFDDWVRLWTGRGYAAIAMDTCGSTPGGKHGERPRHEWSGPPGWGGFDQVDGPAEEQWAYHAVADVVLAHSLIRQLPEVDPDRIGLTGISWGGYLACLASAVDPRFRLAVPVYGCGFLGEDSAWLGAFKDMGEARARRWLDLWDPSRYLPRSRMPFLWVTGTNDFAYPMPSLRKSYRLPPGERTVCVRVRMAHGHGGPGENPEEIHAFADAILRGGDPPPRVREQGLDGQRAWARFESRVPVVRAELNYTRDGGPWKDREWLTVPATLREEASTGGAPPTAQARSTAGAAGTAEAIVPRGATACYINVVDARGLVASGEHIESARPE